MAKGRGMWVGRVLAVSCLSLAAAPADQGGAPAGSPPGSATTALVTVRVPANAELWFDGRKTTQTGVTRQFVTPPLEAGRRYTYRIEVRCPTAEGSVAHSDTVTVWAGGALSLDFSALTPAKVQPAVYTPPPTNVPTPISRIEDRGSRVEPASVGPASRRLEQTGKTPVPPAAPANLPQFGHDPNYSWVVGTLTYSKLEDAWLVRYAPAEEEDRYGGSVTLLDPGRMDGFKSGQRVRVEGQVVSSTRGPQIRPPYRVKRILPLEQP